MRPMLTHTLAPLTRMTSNKSKFKWTKVEQDDFDKIKWTVSCNNLLTHPNFDETFQINTDDSAFQLGAVISHKVKLIAFKEKTH